MCEILPRQEPGPFRFWARTQSGLVGQSGGVAQRQKRDFRQAHRSAFRYGANPCAEPAQGNSKRSLLETLAESRKTACYSGVFLPHPVAVNAHDFEVIEMGAEPAATIATPHTTHRHPSTVVTGTFEKTPRTGDLSSGRSIEKTGLAVETGKSGVLPANHRNYYLQAPTPVGYPFLQGHNITAPS
jgi:hypothetical protein